MTRRNATDADTASASLLTSQQEAAVDLLAVGNTVTQVADAVGVARQTVSEWRNQNAAFQAAVNSRRLDLWAGLQDRLRALLPKAVDVLERSLDDEGKPARDASVQILKACGLYSLPPPTGFTMVEDIEVAGREADGERRRRLMFADL